jgi:hypothetical protein
MKNYDRFYGSKINVFSKQYGFSVGHTLSSFIVSLIHEKIVLHGMELKMVLGHV